MTEVVIEQALYRHGAGLQPEAYARSAGFTDEADAAVSAILDAYGLHTARSPIESAMFALPLDRRRVIVVRVGRHSGASGDYRYHVLLVSRSAYREWIHEPFALLERFPPTWSTFGLLPQLHWPCEQPPGRTVAQVREVLQRVRGPALREDVPAEEQILEESESEAPALLGGVQALVDGGKLVLARSGPDVDVLKALWMLLPNHSRGDLWPASFALDNRLPFDVVVTQAQYADRFRGYLTEEQAADYPEGRYELSLQVAVESGNQRDLDHLLNRRSWNDTWKLGIALLVMFLAIAVISRIVMAPSRQSFDVAPFREGQAKIIGSIVGLGDPLRTSTAYPIARDKLIELEEEVRKWE